MKTGLRVTNKHGSHLITAKIYDSYHKELDGSFTCFRLFVCVLCHNKRTWMEIPGLFDEIIENT